MGMNLRMVTNGLKVYYSNASEAEKIIVDCGLLAAGAAAVGGIIPGLGMAAGAVTTFACVYLAGIMFMNMILVFAKKGVGPEEFSALSESDLKDTIKSQTPDKEDVKQAKNVFKEKYNK